MAIAITGTLPVWQFCDKVNPMLAGHFDLTMPLWHYTRLLMCLFATLSLASLIPVSNTVGIDCWQSNGTRNRTEGIVMAMGLLDDYSFGWSDLVALWLIERPLATLLAVRVMGDTMSMQSECRSRGFVLRVSVRSCPSWLQLPTAGAEWVGRLPYRGLSHHHHRPGGTGGTIPPVPAGQSRRDTLSHHQNDPVR